MADVVRFASGSAVRGGRVVAGWLEDNCFVAPPGEIELKVVNAADADVPAGVVIGCSISLDDATELVRLGNKDDGFEGDVGVVEP
jgi:hypothetical protein